MNLIQQAEQLKNLPDQALAQMQQRPTDTPPYLVVAEMQRRANMRKAYQGAQQGSPMNQAPVAQQMAQQVQGGPPQQQQQPMAPPPMQMAKGGLASVAGYFDGGFVVRNKLPNVDPSMIGMDSFPGYSTMNDARFNAQRGLKAAIPNVRDHAAYVDEMNAVLGESPLKAMAEKLEMEEKDMRGKKPKLSQILMQLGLGMAASRRPDLGGAIAEGGIGALNGYTQERDRTQMLADRIAEKRLRAIEGSQRHNDRIQDYAIDARRGDIAAANTAAAGNNNIELGIMRQAAAESHDASVMDKQEMMARSALELAAQKAEADEKRRMGEKVFDRETAIAVAKLKAQGKGGGKGEAKASNKDELSLMDNFNQMANSYEQQALKLTEALSMAGIPKDQADLLRQKVGELNQAAQQYRSQAAALGEKIMGIHSKPKSDLGTGSLFAPIPDYSRPGAGTRGMPPPLFIPPPPRR